MQFLSKSKLSYNNCKWEVTFKHCLKIKLFFYQKKKDLKGGTMANDDNIESMAQE